MIFKKKTVEQNQNKSRIRYVVQEIYVLGQVKIRSKIISSFIPQDTKGLDPCR